MLFPVIGWRDPIKHFEAAQGGQASLGLVEHYTSHNQPNDVAGGPEVVGAAEALVFIRWWRKARYFVLCL